MAASERWIVPRGALYSVGAAFAATLLVLAPSAWTRPPRDAWHATLRPPTAGLDRAWAGMARWATALGTRQQLAADVQRLDRRVAELAAENHRLRDALLSHQAAAQTAEHGTGPLLGAGLVTARVLGHQARRFATNRLLVDAGTSHAAQPDDLALVSLDAGAAIVDVGAQGGLRPGELALSRQVVWGKLCDVGHGTSRVRRVTDAEYRDLVLIAPPGAAPLDTCARGVWEGTGDRLVQVTRVATSWPIRVGDHIFSGALRGAVDSLPACGEVVRVERVEESPHWKIAARPWAPPEEPGELSIVRLNVRAERVAGLTSPLTPAQAAGVK